jgi:small subunit ribosomal protein S16
VAVKIRLKKMGRTHRPFFRVCAMDTRSPRDGRVIEQLGTYDPMVPETDARAILNGERISYWLGVGAQPSPKVGTLIKKYGKDGSHLEAQAEAITRLGGRRAAAIEEARAAIASTKMPDVTKPAEDEAAAPAEGEAEAAAPADGESKTEEAAAEAPAEEKKEAPAEEAKAEAPAEEAKAEEKTEAPAEPAAEEKKAE